MIFLMAVELLAQLLLLLHPYQLTWIWGCFLTSAGCFLLVGLLYARRGGMGNFFSVVVATVAAVLLDWTLWRQNAPTNAVLALAIQQWGAIYCMLSFLQARIFDWEKVYIRDWDTRHWHFTYHDGGCQYTGPRRWWLLICWSMSALLPPLSWLDGWGGFTLQDGLVIRSVMTALLTLYLGLAIRRDRGTSWRS